MMSVNTIAKLFLVAGVLLLSLGLLLLLFEKCSIPFGKLPGDFVFRRKNITIAFPFMTMLIISLLLTVGINIFWRWFR
jgi:hypothetical protein